MLIISSGTQCIELTVENRLIVVTPSGLIRDREDGLIILLVDGSAASLSPLTALGDMDADRAGRFMPHHLFSVAVFFALRVRLYDIKVTPCWIERFMIFNDLRRWLVDDFDLDL
jgi:hypothetical protein